jgi:hypothetical protein
MEPSALHVLGECSTTELSDSPNPKVIFLRGF